MSDNHLISRDLSWLAFNARVLQEASDPKVPLLERLRFLAIFSSNLDEFYRVRIAALRQFSQLKKNTKQALSIQPQKQLKKIARIVSAQQTEFGRIYNHEILPSLRTEGLFILSREEIVKSHLSFIDSFFEEHIEAKLDRIDWQPGEAVPLLQDKKIYLACTYNTGQQLSFFGLPVPELPRFVKLPVAVIGKEIFAFLDDIISHGLLRMLPSAKNVFAIKLSRDADLNLGDEYSGDLLEKIKKSLEKRNIGPPTRLLFDRNMPYYMVHQLVELFDLSPEDLVPGARYHNFSDFMGFPVPTNKNTWLNPPLPPLPHPAFQGIASHLSILAQREVLLHFPYQQYQYIPDLICEAAENPLILEIKISLYRVASNSAVIEALLLACAQAKQVTVFIEAKARFDEAANLEAGKRLEQAGAKVLYSYPGIKVHAKMLLILEREEPEGTKKKGVAFLCTGNFNEKTARIYADHGLLTNNPDLVADTARVFDLLEGKTLLPRCKKVIVAPYNLRAELIRLIGAEISRSKEGGDAWLTLKMNSLEDPEIIQWLYEASRAGVRINLIVRGICCLKAGVPGLSENITAISIVDRFLEHARIYVFANGGYPLIYLSSADCMTRNLDRRVEIAWPVETPELREELLKSLELQLSDNCKARIQDPKQQNHYREKAESDAEIRAQTNYYHYLRQKLI